jgi:hypothetical protein
MTQQRLNSPLDFQELTQYLTDNNFQLSAPVTYPCICVYHLVSGPDIIGETIGVQYMDLEYTYVYLSDLA